MAIRARKIALALSVCGMLAAGTAGAVDVTVYQSSGTPDLGVYGSEVGTFSTASADFTTNWHPLGQLGDFAAVLTGGFDVAGGGTYTFGLSSDDGSYLEIDGHQVIKSWVPQSPFVTTGSIDLTAGYHSFRIDYFECCGGEAELVLALHQYVTYAAAVPEPETYAMLMAGLGILGGMARRRTKA